MVVAVVAIVSAVVSDTFDPLSDGDGVTWVSSVAVGRLCCLVGIVSVGFDDVNCVKSDDLSCVIPVVSGDNGIVEIFVGDKSRVLMIAGLTVSVSLGLVIVVWLTNVS